MCIMGRSCSQPVIKESCYKVPVIFMISFSSIHCPFNYYSFFSPVPFSIQRTLLCLHRNPYAISSSCAKAVDRILYRDITTKYND